MGLTFGPFGPFVSLVKYFDYSKDASITNRPSTFNSLLTAPVWHLLFYIKFINRIETASLSPCPLKVNIGFSIVLKTNNCVFLLCKTGDSQRSRHAMMLKQELHLGLK